MRSYSVPKKITAAGEGEAGGCELPNLISALCVQHNSINMCNVWDLTVYQLYDQFLRQSYLNQVNIHAMNYAAGAANSTPTTGIKSYRQLPAYHGRLAV